MTLALVASVLGIAVVDSVNPSALAMTAYLLTLDDPLARVRAYLAGIALLYLAIGCVVVFVLGSAVGGVLEALSSPAAGIGLQAVLGVAAFAMGVSALRRRRRPTARPTPAVPTVGRAFALGLIVTAVEATTALPYLGALALVVRADASALATVALLVAYTAVFVLPPVVLVITAQTRSGQRLVARLRRPRRRHGALPITLGSAGAVVGAGLFVHAAVTVLCDAALPLT